MNVKLSLLPLFALTLGIGCADPGRSETAAAILAPGMADAVFYGDVSGSKRSASFHFKDDPWLGEINGELTRSGTGYEDWHYDLGLESFGDERMDFTGDMQLDTYVDSDFGFQTITLTGEVTSSFGAVMEVDLDIDVTDEDAYYAVEWVGEINGTKVKGKVEEKEDMGDEYDDCRTPVEVDCG